MKTVIIFLTEQRGADGIVHNILIIPADGECLIVSVMRFDLNLFADRKALESAAAKLIGEEEVPCIVLQTNEEQSAVFALIENIQRKNLNFFEEAIAISKLIKKWDMTQEEVAIKIGKAQSTVANKLRLLKFKDEHKIKILMANLTERHARALLKLPSYDDVDSILKIVISKKLNVAETESLVDNILFKKTKPKRKYIPIIKDVRIFFNTINGAIKTMRKAGVMAKLQKEEEDGYIKYIVKIPNATKQI